MDNIDQVRLALQTVQAAETGKLSRRDILGSALSFDDALPDAEKLVALFKQIPVHNIDLLPPSYLGTLHAEISSVMSIFQSAMDYDAKTHGPNVRDTILTNIKNQYGQTFSALHSIISFLKSQDQDSSLFEANLKKTSDQFIKDLEKLKSQNEEASKEIAGTLSQVKKLSAEQGVSQQASYFKDQADHHDKLGFRWLIATIVSAILLLIYVAATFIVDALKIPSDAATYLIAQYVTSKVLVFGVLAYLLLFCSRTLAAHRHNVVINRHRQTALQTFNVLANAAKDNQSRDIVLTQAAGCIFTPQDTGYSKSAGSNGGNWTIIDSLAKVLATAK